MQPPIGIPAPYNFPLVGISPGLAEVFLSAAARSIAGRRNFSDNLPQPNFRASLGGIANAEILTKIFGQSRDQAKLGAERQFVGVRNWRLGRDRTLFTLEKSGSHSRDSSVMKGEGGIGHAN